MHYGTESDPYLCCMCQPALDYTSDGGSTVFSLEHGLERSVGNDRVFLSQDGRAWYCEGIREIGRSSQKCGLIPPLANIPSRNINAV